MFLPQTNTALACEAQTQQLLKIISKNPPSPAQPWQVQGNPRDAALTPSPPAALPGAGAAQGSLLGSRGAPAAPRPLLAAGIAEHNGAETAQSCRAKYIPVAGEINNKQQHKGDGTESLVLLGLGLQRSGYHTGQQNPTKTGQKQQLQWLNK